MCDDAVLTSDQFKKVSCIQLLSFLKKQTQLCIAAFKISQDFTKKDETLVVESVVFFLFFYFYNSRWIDNVIWTVRKNLSSRLNLFMIVVFLLYGAS